MHVSMTGFGLMTTEEKATALAKAMYLRQTIHYGAQPALAELAWTVEPDIQAFWTAEAHYVLTTLEELQ